MSRVVKSEKHHGITIREDDYEACLVKGKSRAYLWVGPIQGNRGIYTFSNADTLRKLAQAILKEVGP